MLATNTTKPGEAVAENTQSDRILTKKKPPNGTSLFIPISTTPTVTLFHQRTCDPPHRSPPSSSRCTSLPGTCPSPRHSSRHKKTRGSWLLWWRKLQKKNTRVVPCVTLGATLISHKERNSKQLMHLFIKRDKHDAACEFTQWEDQE